MSVGVFYCLTVSGGGGGRDTGMSTRPLIVRFQAVIENRMETYFHLSVHGIEWVSRSAITACDTEACSQTKRGRLEMNTPNVSPNEQVFPGQKAIGWTMITVMITTTTAGGIMLQGLCYEEEQFWLKLICTLLLVAAALTFWQICVTDHKELQLLIKSNDVISCSASQHPPETLTLTPPSVPQVSPSAVWWHVSSKTPG